MVAIIWEPGFREPKKLQYPHFGFHMIATIAGNCFPYDRYDRCDHWTFLFSAITAITTIIWKPGYTDDVSCRESFEKWMIHSFRPSQKVWTKFRQNLHQYYLFVYFFSHPINSSSDKGTQKLFIQENSEDCQAQPKQKTAFIKPNWRRNTQIKAF